MTYVQYIEQILSRSLRNHDQWRQKHRNPEETLHIINMYTHEESGKRETRNGIRETVKCIYLEY